jgi:hypothetical protein
MLDQVNPPSCLMKPLALPADLFPLLKLKKIDAPTVDPFQLKKRDLDEIKHPKLAHIFPQDYDHYIFGFIY